MSAPAASADVRESGQPLGKTDWLSFLILCVPLMGATILAKFAIPPFGERGLSIALPAILGALILGLVAGRLRAMPWRLVLYLSVIGFLGLLQVMRQEPYSATSILLLAALHLPYAFGGSSESGLRIVPVFLGLAAFLACCGIAQFLLQPVVDVRFLFPIENLLPQSLVVQQFNQQGLVGYGDSLYRSNGIFLLEPSFFSQLLAVAIVLELCTFNRLRRHLVYLLGILVSYSGTGLLILAVCAPVAIVAKRRWRILMLVALIAGALVAIGDQFGFDRLVARSTEFGASGSSGFARFVGGYYFFNQFLWGDLQHSLLGFGAGSFSSYASRADYPVAEMAIVKMIFEYGLVGASAYFGFLCYCLWSSSLPRVVVAAIAMTFVLSGLYIPFSHGLALSLLVWLPGPWKDRWPRRSALPKPDDGREADLAAGRLADAVAARAG